VTLHINGEAKETKATTVAELVTEWTDTKLTEGDRLELMRISAGG
jgi:sulfur carrier protein ThiS